MQEQFEICPICELRHPHLIHSFNQSYEADIIRNIESEFPGWSPRKGICGRCFDEFEAITYHPYSVPTRSIGDFKLRHLDFYILPIIDRLNACVEFTGRGVTICFIDSGFYLHPDIRDRVVKTVDITNGNEQPEYLMHPHEEAWHGTMTATVCAGNGSLSGGLYKGIANEAQLVLIKTQNEHGQITDEAIADALNWVKKNHEQYGIRVVNLSLGADMEDPTGAGAISMLAEELFAMNILVIAAAGNSLDKVVFPPASSPNVLAVGGLDDQNKLDGDIILYPSSYGVSANGQSKPEIVSNAIWIPAPILPETSLSRKAKVLFQALENEDYMSAIIENNRSVLHEDHVNLYQGKEQIWKEVKKIFWREKFITPHYMHADGTSFAAPIVTSVVAQMLEANPGLTAQQIREVLLHTAMPIPTYDIKRQGYGRLQPRMAVYAVMPKEIVNFTEPNPIIDLAKQRVTFYIYLPHARDGVSLVGDFTNWKKNQIFLKPSVDGTWFTTIPLLPPGRYEYKFFVDNHQWIEDIRNSWRVIDHYGGWNNVFEITDQ
jgi:serine protease AprX